MVTNTIYFFFEKNSKWLVLFAILSRVTIALLPNLKYEWFLGTAIDQHRHFRASHFICDNGYVEPRQAYAETPIIHVLIASFSKISAIPILNAFKILPVISWSIFPAMIYSLIKRTFDQYKKSSLMKYGLLISSVPIEASLSYVVTGSFFGTLWAFLALSVFLISFDERRREYIVLAILFSVALVFSHFVSSTLMMVAFMIILLLVVLRIYKFKSMAPTFLVFFVLLELSWITAQLGYATGPAGELELTLRNFWRGIMGMEPEIWSPTGIRFRLFDLNLLDTIRVMTVFHGGDAIILLFSLLGIVTVWKTSRLKSAKFLSYYILLLWMFVPFQLLMTGGSAGLVQYFRVISHTLVICPIIIAFFMYYVDGKFRRGKPVIFALFLVIIILSTIQMYGYQPLLPPSSTISESLPSDEPVVFLTWIGANTIYQRSMIRHVESYAPEEMRVAADRMTQNQIVGLTDYRFSDEQLVNYSPLWNTTIERRRDYDLFLIHFPGKAGGLEERAESRTKQLILGAILYSNVLYTNGESYTLIYPRVMK
jgi:hypothetical protein